MEARQRDAATNAGRRQNTFYREEEKKNNNGMHSFKIQDPLYCGEEQERDTAAHVERRPEKPKNTAEHSNRRQYPIHRADARNKKGILQYMWKEVRILYTASRNNYETLQNPIHRADVRNKKAILQHMWKDVRILCTVGKNNYEILQIILPNVRIQCIMTRHNKVSLQHMQKDIRIHNSA